MKRDTVNATIMIVIGSLMIAAMITVCVFVPNAFRKDKRGDPPPWIGIALAGVAIAGIGIWMLYQRPSRVLVVHPPYPDLLAHVPAPLFDCYGVRFKLEVLNVEGIATIYGWFQNRFDAPRVLNLRMSGDFGLYASLMVDVPGGAHGVIESPIGLPQESQGKTVGFTLNLDGKRPAGLGAAGLPVEGVVVERSAARDTSIVLIAVFTGAVRFPNSVRYFAEMPTKVAASVPAGMADRVRILWRPDHTFVVREES